MAEITQAFWEFSFSIGGDLTEKEASALFDAMMDVACGGAGDGAEHVCAREVAASMRPTPPDLGEWIAAPSSNANPVHIDLPTPPETT